MHPPAPAATPTRSRWLTLPALLAFAVLVGIVLAGALVRAAWRRVLHSDRTEVIMFPADPVSGFTWRVEFYDGAHRQLADRRLVVTLVDPHGPAADATLARVARQCVAEVESRDGQRCFEPVVEVLDAAGRLVRRFEAFA